MLIITFRQSIQDDGVGPRTGRRREFQPQCGIVLFINLQDFHFLQHFHPRLHLVGFRKSASEAVDKLLVVVDEFLLFVELLLLLFPALCAQLQVGGIVYFVIVDPAHGDFNGAGSDVVNKSLVVRNHDHCFGAVDQEIFEPLYRLGAQCWMKENLNIGTRVNRNQEQTNNNVIEKYCFTDDESACVDYGGLYQWAEMVQYLNGGSNTGSWNPAPSGDVRGICPTGWHLPSDEELTILINFLGGDDVAGGKLKEAGEVHWNSPNTGADNSGGFTALPSGFRNLAGGSDARGFVTYFWSAGEANATDAYWRYIFYDGTGAYRDYYQKVHGYSVRCIQN